jgi:hypothetical protein
MVSAFAATGFERVQNSLDSRRRVRWPLDVEWFAVFAEDKLFSAVRRGSAAENAARLFVIGARRKPEPPGITDRASINLRAASGVIRNEFPSGKSRSTKSSW